MAIAKRVSLEELRAKQEKSAAELLSKQEAALTETPSDSGEKQVKIAKKVQTAPRSKKVNLSQIADYAERAPDGKKADKPKSKWVLKGRKVIITVPVDPAQLEELDKLAEELGQSRPALIRAFIQQAIDKASAKARKNRL